MAQPSDARNLGAPGPVLAGVRDPERARRAQSGVLLGLAVGPSTCLGAWLALRGCELISGEPSPGESALLAGAIGLVAMLASARWGER